MGTLKHFQLVGVFICYNPFIFFFYASFVSLLFPLLFHCPNEVIKGEGGASVPLLKEEAHIHLAKGACRSLRWAVPMLAWNCSPHPGMSCCILPFPCQVCVPLHVFPCVNNFYSQRLLCPSPAPLTQNLPHLLPRALPSTAWKRVFSPFMDQAWHLGLAHGTPMGPCPANEQLWRRPSPAAGRCNAFLQGRNKVLLAARPLWRPPHHAPMWWADGGHAGVWPATLGPRSRSPICPAQLLAPLARLEIVFQWFPVCWRKFIKGQTGFFSISIYQTQKLLRCRRSISLTCCLVETLAETSSDPVAWLPSQLKRSHRAMTGERGNGFGIFFTWRFP